MSLKVYYRFAHLANNAFTMENILTVFYVLY